MKKVQLKNIVTEVPDTAVLVEDWSTLNAGDFILVVDDVKKFTAGIERNNRLFTQVKRVEKTEKQVMIIIGGHYTDKANRLNATTCTSGVNYQKDGEDNNPVFLIR